MCVTPSSDSPLGKFYTARGLTTGAGKSSGVASSGGIGFGLPATKQSQSARMARRSSSANFMALFGPQGATQ